MKIELTKEIRISDETCEAETWYWIRKDNVVHKGFKDEEKANKYFAAFVELQKKHNGSIPPETVLLSEII